MSSSNCCFLTCIQVSQEAGQVVWYSHLFKNFPCKEAILTLPTLQDPKKWDSSSKRLPVWWNCFSELELSQTALKSYTPGRSKSSIQKVSSSPELNYSMDCWVFTLNSHSDLTWISWPTFHGSVAGFPGGTSGKEPTCQCRRLKRPGFHPWAGKIPWRKKWQPSPVFLPGESHE